MQNWDKIEFLIKLDEVEKEHIMKRRSFLQKSALIGGALASYPILSNCKRDEEILKEFPFKSKFVKSGYESPGGLSIYRNLKKYSNLKNAHNPTALEDLIFCENPLFPGSLDHFVQDYNPKIYRYVGDLSETEILYEFTQEYLEDFLTFSNSVTTDVQIEDWNHLRPIGLLLNTAILDDGTILFLSNLSKRIYDVTHDVKSTYLENDELIGTSDMIYGSDGKIYCAQHPIRIPGSLAILRPKRIISIDTNTKSINLEFTLPNGEYSNLGEPANYNSIYSGCSIETGAQVRIIENINKSLDPSKFYILDSFAQTIYKVSDLNILSILNNTIHFPSSLAIDNSGIIYVVNSPVLIMFPPSLAECPKLISINPSTGEQSVLYTFGNETDTKYHILGTITGVNIDGIDYFIPRGFYISAEIIETNETLNYYYSDSIIGEVGCLTMTKSM